MVHHSGRGKEKKAVNLLLVILEFLLPFCDQRLSLKDRQLVEWCKSKLGKVRKLDKFTGILSGIALVSSWEYILGGA